MVFFFLFTRLEFCGVSSTFNRLKVFDNEILMIDIFPMSPIFLSDQSSEMESEFFYILPLKEINQPKTYVAVNTSLALCVFLVRNCDK